MGKPWLKLWTETLHDRKLRRIDPAHRWAWIGILLLAAETDDSGRLLVGEHDALTDEDISDALALDIVVWKAAKRYFLRMGMLHEEAGILAVTNYDKRQEPKDRTAAARMKRYRERKTHKSVTRNSDVTLRNGYAVESESESESERGGEDTPSGLDKAIDKLHRFGLFTQPQLAQLTSLYDDLEQSKRLDWIDAACDVGAANGASTPAYVLKVLANAIHKNERPSTKPAASKRLSVSERTALMLQEAIHGD